LFNNLKRVAPRAVALLLASVSANAVAAQEAIIISDGTGDATSAANGLKARLEVAGYNVNIQTTLDTLNADPTAIAQVWDVRITKPLTAGEKTDYLSYLNNAGGLFLLGEHSGFAIRNDSLLDFILSAGGGAVTMTPSIVQTQYVTESFNGSGLIVPAVALPITVPAAGTFSAAGNGTFITTTEPNGTGNGTGVAFGAGSLTNAPTGRLLSYLDVNTFQAAHYNSNLALRAIVDRMIGFVAGNFQVDPDLPPVGGGGGGGPAVIDGSQPSYNLGDPAATGSTIDFDGGTLDLTGGADPTNLVTADISITDNGAFVNTSGNSGTFAGTITGTGGLIVSGQGTLALTGTNAYAGGTVITDDATLSIDNAQALGTGGVALMDGRLHFDMDGTVNAPVTMMAGVNILDTGANDVTMDGNITGTGGFIVSGQGTLALTGTNTHAGGTIITDDSTLAINSAQALGTGGVTLADGRLRFGMDGAVNAPVTLMAGVNTLDTFGHNVTLDGAITGAGPVIVSGQGTLALTGTNTYAGGTIITDDSTLAINSAQALGTGGVTMMQGRLLFGAGGAVDAPLTLMAGVNTLDTFGHNVTLGGAITGTGGFLLSGQGTLTLTGTNSHAGGTLVTDNSTLTINNAQALGTGGVTLADGRLRFGMDGAVNASVTLMNGVNTLDTGGRYVTLGGAITGAGPVTVSGQGWLTLTGANSHAGGTLVTDNSTLAINNAQALGTGGVTLADGRLRFGMDGAVNAPLTLIAGINQLDTGGRNVTLGGAITGTGGFLLSGQGTLALTGTNTHAGGILVTDDSTLSINNAQALGTGGVGLANGRLRFDMDGAVDAPVTLMAGVNTLDTGVHNVTIGGSITGTGGFVKTGSARLNLTGDSDYSGTTFVSDGRLAVNGSILNSGFIVESGASIGGNGNLGGLIVRTNATAAPGNSIGQLSVATTVLFEQGSVYEVEVDASGASDRIEATGVATLEGGTVRVLAEAGNYRPQTSYQILTAAGGVVGEFENVSSNLAFLLPTLSYGANAVTLTLTRNDVRFVDVADTANQRATAGAIGGSFGAETPVYYELVGQSAEGARAAFDSLSGEIHSSTLTVAAQQTDEIRRALLNRMTLPAGEGTTLWTDVNRNWNQFDGNRNAAEVSNDAYGFQVGVESQMGDVRVGVSGGYRSGDASLGARRSEADLEEVSGAVYARGDVGAFALRLGATYSNYDFRTRRTAQAGDISQELTATYGGRAIQTFGEVGRAVPLGIGKVEPFVGLNAMWLKNDAFTETGGSLALTSENKERRRAWSTLGLKASVPLIVGSPVNFGAKVGWQRALTRSTVESDLAFAAGGPDFSVEGVPLARDAAVVDAGVHWMSEQGLGLSVTYNGSFANGQSHVARAVLSFNF